MSLWRNILTALWAAILGGGAAFFVLTLLGELRGGGAQFFALPLTSQLAFLSAGVIAVSALASFVWVPMLWGAVAGTGGLLLVALAGWQGLFPGTVPGNPSGLVAVLIPSALILVGSLGFLLWETESRQHQKKSAEASLKAF
jgi:hypothetical protein